MPYIKANDGRREALRKGEPALTAGELNYQLFYLIKHNYNVYENDEDFISFKLVNFVSNFLGENPNYQKYNDMTGCLTLCYKEIKRRLGLRVYMLLEMRDEYESIIAKYEDEKIISNGDVE